MDRRDEDPAGTSRLYTATGTTARFDVQQGHPIPTRLMCPIPLVHRTTDCTRTTVQSSRCKPYQEPGGSRGEDRRGGADWI